MAQNERGEVLTPGPRVETADADLVQRALRHDRWAEEALFRRYAPLVISVATRLVGNRADGEDVAQETFTLALERLASLRDPAAFRGWILRIASSRAHRIFRRRKLLSYVGFGAPDEEGLLAIAAPDAGPDTHTELRLIDSALASAPREQRTAWLLRRVEGLSILEAADACRCSTATVKRWIDAVDSRLARHTESS